MAPVFALLLVLAGPDLASLKDRARVGVVFGSGALARRQREALAGKGARERDLVVLTGTPGMARRFGLPSAPGFAFVLVGKDGGVKLVRRTFVSRRELFALIDAMPMRRAEMGRRGSS